MSVSFVELKSGLPLAGRWVVDRRPAIFPPL